MGDFCGSGALLPPEPKIPRFLHEMSKWRDGEKKRKTRQSQRQKHLVLLGKKLCPKIHNVTYESRPQNWHFWPLWPFFQKKTKFCTEARQHDHPAGSAFFKLCPKLCPKICNGPGGRATRSCGHPIIKKHSPTTTRCNRDGISPQICRAFG